MSHSLSTCFLTARSPHRALQVKPHCSPEPRPQTSWNRRDRPEAPTKQNVTWLRIFFLASKYNSQQVLDIVLILRILRLLRVIVSIQR